MPHWTDIWPEIVAKAAAKSVLQLGCGTATYLAGAVNVDMNPETSPDVLCDLNQMPYPFGDNSFDAVVAISILEHLNDFFAVMGEIHRIAKHDASIYILVPHFSSASSYIDPTHRLRLSARSCDYFIKGSAIEKEFNFYVPYRYRLEKRFVDLNGFLNYIPFLRWIAQRYPVFWENYLCFMIRGGGIFWELKVVKR